MTTPSLEAVIAVIDGSTSGKMTLGFISFVTGQGTGVLRQCIKNRGLLGLWYFGVQPRHQTVKLERPRVFYAKVFNAEQIDGLAPFVPQTPSFDPVLRADALIAGSGIPVYHDQNDRAFYSPSKDEIHLPVKSAFTSQAAYYEVSLHELGHATGHQTRLNRSFGPRRSEGYGAAWDGAAKSWYVPLDRSPEGFSQWIKKSPEPDLEQTAATVAKHQEGVKGHGVKVNAEGQMVVPCRDAKGRLWSIQTVSEDGKRFLKDSHKTATIAAFDSGNLLAVAEAVRAKFPDRQIVIAADNDHANKLGNVGITKAAEAAKAIGAVLAAPRFTAEEMALKLTDFNDLAKSRGNGAVKQAINTALAHSREPERSIA